MSIAASMDAFTPSWLTIAWLGQEQVRWLVKNSPLLNTRGQEVPPCEATDFVLGALFQNFAEPT